MANSSRPRSLWHDALWRFRQNRMAFMGVVLVGILCIVAILAPVITRYEPSAINYGSLLQGPSGEHWFGTDFLGRDLFSRVVHGARISLLVGVVAVAIAMLIGVPLGLAAGFFGGAVDAFVMRLVDIFLAFPVILLAIAIMSILGPSIFNVMIALGLVGWTKYARLVRGIVLGLRESEFVTAATALGARSSRILVRHLLPNSVAPLIVLSTFGLAEAVVVEAALSFLGLGVQPPTPSWGGILNEGRSYMRQAAHITTFPGIAIVITILGFNFIGDGLRDAMDPKGVD